MRRGITYLLVFVALLTSCGKENTEQVAEPVQSSPPLLRPVPTQVNEQIKGYYAAFPEIYNTTSEPLPAMIFIHGAGQFGNGKNDLPMLLQEGITQQLDEKKIPASFTVNGYNYSLLYFSPQFSSEFSIPALHEFIQFIKSTYRIDTSRIYIAGISRGAELACEYATAHPQLVSAVISMAGGLAEETRDASATTLALNNVPIWAIHNTADELIPSSNSEMLIQLIHQYNPEASALLTLLSPQGPLNHDCWTRATAPQFKVNNLNIYEWALQFRK
ncbi:MAG TPA: dienelactone hydrolase family protein [Flavitalea sp.]|nr:dienelactone hydrolase family protein [Flavitalea sp.]